MSTINYYIRGDIAPYKSLTGNLLRILIALNKSEEPLSVDQMVSLYGWKKTAVEKGCEKLISKGLIVKR